MKWTVPVATTTAEITTPNIDSVSIGSASPRSSAQCSDSAASNKRGGRITSKMKSCVSVASISTRAKTNPIPVMTSPTVYGRRMRRAIMATKIATTSNATVRDRIRSMTRAFWRESLKLGSNRIERVAGIKAVANRAC